MAIETQDKTINGNLYQMILPPPTVCIPLSTRALVLLAPVISGGLGASFTGVTSAGTVAEKIKALLGPALVSMTAAFSKADPEALNLLMMDTVKVSHLCFEGKAISAEHEFNKHFGSYRPDTFQVMLWVLWECIKDFFPKQEGSALQSMKTGILSAFLSQMDGQMTGGSGAPAGKASADTEN